jgi:branched-chain amino acid transport system substrate-binding protein
MRRSFAAVITFALAMLPSLGAQAQDTIRIGLIMPYSGQFADTAVQMDNGIKLYVQRHGSVVAGRTIEFIRKDTGGVAPDVAKRLAQELVVRDKVDILAGFVLTPNALAAAEVSAEAKKLMVIMNAGTSIITTRSPYSTRTSVTLPQVAEAFGQWAAKNGTKRVYSMVSDFGPGHDAEQGFHRAFKEAGGEIIGSVRFPVANPDFSAFVQRAKDLDPEAIFLFVPAGAQPAAFAKALTERGLSPKTTKILGTGEVTAEAALRGMGEASLGIVTAWNYDYFQDTGINKAFVKDYATAFSRNPDFMSVGGYDGMHLIYEALRKAGGKTDGSALIEAAKGMKWRSPRGVIAIDPETRDVVQNIYIRRVEKVDGAPHNVIIDTIESVKDPVLARLKR